ncbi:FAD-binding oxidoreductase [Planomonospora sp. ID67723]|uniref:FAD-binding oxidoreductase n=1 Tax=Planomonospora sp. ID67723 TaxID=2738134 RepID=UPI0018C35E84|nr:FAD-binding oxidoreductase [Planomonospora sp. ID67723]MBG0829082.1 FAD-binding oxidoreductase [Planomonospora sp. ID67723]
MSHQVQRPPYAVDGESGGAAAAQLSRGFGGPVYLPGDAGYERERQAPYSDIDPRPAVVAMASDHADVQTAITTAREHGLPFSVQGTGHGTHAACNGGILLKTSEMASVLVDPDRQVARVGAGAVWEQVIAAAEPFGLAPLAGSHQSVGVAGYTLGGGVGWLGRKYGFAADSVLSAEVAGADGRLLKASADEHPDLFWALRGGGGNFGVVTSLEFRLYPVGRVYAGVAYFAAERAAETLARYRDWTADAPDELSTSVLLTRLPRAPEVPAAVRGRRVLAIQVMYAGEEEQARRALAPLWQAAGPALSETFRSSSFGAADMGGTGPAQVNLLDTLPDPVIDALVAAAARPDSPVLTAEIRHWGGAMGRPGPDAGPVGHRTVRFATVLDGWVPEVDEALRPYAAGRSFLNFLHDPARAETAYAPGDHRRLREVKRAYDPDNFFHLNYNIPPAPPRAR